MPQLSRDTRSTPEKPVIHSRYQLLCYTVTMRLTIAIWSNSHTHTHTHTVDVYSTTNVHDGATQRSFIHQFGLTHLCVKELLEHVCALVVIGVRFVERSAVRKQSCHVGDEQMLVNVIVALEAVAYSLQICQKCSTTTLIRHWQKWRHHWCLNNHKTTCTCDCTYLIGAANPPVDLTQSTTQSLNMVNLDSAVSANFV